MFRPLLVVGLVACGDASKTDSDTEESNDSTSDTASMEDDSGSTEGDPETPDTDLFCEGPTMGAGTAVASANCTLGVCQVGAGEFVMGSVSDRADECPSHLASVDAYGIDQFEVTWAQYDACVAAEVCASPPEACRQSAEELAGEGGIEGNPVICVDYAAATTYCGFVGGRLPTEAEWEKAARGTDGARWPWGSLAPTCDLANYRFVSWYCNSGPLAVGSYDVTSSYGTHDMAGNVWEWTADFYDAEAYRGTDRNNPTGPTSECRDSVGGAIGPCVDRVIRGGAYNVTAINIRSSARGRAEPDWYDVNLGVRCAY